MNNPWPEAPLSYQKTYAQEEGCIEEYAIDTVAFRDEDGDGHVDALMTERVEWAYDENNQRADKIVLESGVRIPADLVLLAIGFRGAEVMPFAKDGLEVTEAETIKVDQRMMTNLPGVFAAGDANMGASIVVWAIGEGRDVACHIDRYLMGSTHLPPSLRTTNRPIETQRWKIIGGWG